MAAKFEKHPPNFEEFLKNNSKSTTTEVQPIHPILHDFKMKYQQRGDKLEKDPDNLKRQELKERLKTQFNKIELRELCFDLGIEWEDIERDSKTDIVLELISYANRHNRLEDLDKQVKLLRK